MGVRICIFCIEDKQASESATKGGIKKLCFSTQNELRGHSILRGQEEGGMRGQ